MSTRETLETYYWLHKPGIVYSNAMAAAAGFLLAARGHIHVDTLLATIIGTSLIVASGCVYNNYIDRHIDGKMERTKRRGIASGAVSGHVALSYATLLSIIGFVVLAIWTNWLTVAVGLTGLFFYVVVYGIGKRRTIHGTLIGTISGATPPVAGYVAATNRLDGAALILFLILVCWQLPHFYAIAMFRRNDYAAAGIPVWPVKRGMRSTKWQILVYTVAFIGAIVALAAFGYAGLIYGGVMTALGLWWLWRGVQGFTARDDIVWARQMFGLSLIILLVFCTMLSLDAYLP